MRPWLLSLLIAPLLASPAGAAERSPCSGLGLSLQEMVERMLIGAIRGYLSGEKGPSGCLLIGLLVGLFEGPWPIRPEYRIGLLTGVLGGYTTFSTFGLESFRLANAGEIRLAMLNLVLSCVVGFVAVLIGYRVAERWFSA